MSDKSLRLTRKQREIMLQLLRGNMNEDGITIEWLDIDQLLERLPYETTKASIQFSIRALVEKGLVEKRKPELRRGRKRRILMPTNLAFDTLTSTPPAKVSEYEDGNFVEYT